jgi:(p)ppGpp synthase/HD superfamily hydrolase
VDVVARARRFAVEAYADPAELVHPEEVAELVAEAGYPPEVVAAALLHDLIEDTHVVRAAIAAEVGPDVAALVDCMTEDASIPEYAERKAEHRARVDAAGEACAAIFVADKISNVRRMRRGEKRPDPKKLAHYAATLELMRRDHPELALLDQLDQELGGVRA